MEKQNCEEQLEEVLPELLMHPEKFTVWRGLIMDHTFSMKMNACVNYNVVLAKNEKKWKRPTCGFNKTVPKVTQYLKQWPN